MLLTRLKRRGQLITIVHLVVQEKKTARQSVSGQ
nr:MAG TPA: hypothetical protein [Caudoviricetes sp.]